MWRGVFIWVKPAMTVEPGAWRHELVEGFEGIDTQVDGTGRKFALLDEHEQVLLDLVAGEQQW